MAIISSWVQLDRRDTSSADLNGFKLDRARHPREEYQPKLKIRVPVFNSCMNRPEKYVDQQFQILLIGGTHHKNVLIFDSSRILLLG